MSETTAPQDPGPGLQQDLALALKVAQEAGNILLDYWNDRTALTVDSKRAGDFVSEADRGAEAHIRKELRRVRPGDAWLGEESGAAAGGPRRWIVDPLDGTTNFLHGIGHWAVSVALEDQGRLRVAVVHDPLKGETFTAIRGGGAFLNGHSIAASGAKDMSAALFGTGIPFGAMSHIDEHAADIARLMPHCAGVRRMGAAALDLAYVAAGRLDGFWERSLQPWDIAAGLLLLGEAGASVEGWTQQENPAETGTVITATPALFAEFSACLRNP